MSLINEALKKARTAPPTSSRATATAAGPELHPVEENERARNGSIFTVPFVIALAVMLAVIVIWAWHRAGRVELVVRANTPATAVTATPFAVAPAPAVTTVPVAMQETTTPTMAAAPVVATRADIISTTTVTALEAPKPAAPGYRLDGVFFRPNRAGAVINGQLVYVGSRLDEARVTAIDRDSVTIVTPAGQTNVLVMSN